MLTTYKLDYDELDYKLIDKIKESFPNKKIIIDIYENEDTNLEVKEITNPKIIKRINDINSNQNIVLTEINF